MWNIKVKILNFISIDINEDVCHIDLLNIKKTENSFYISSKRLRKILSSIQLTSYDEYVHIHTIWFLKSTLHWSTPIPTYINLDLKSGWVITFFWPQIYPKFLQNSEAAWHFSPKMRGWNFGIFLLREGAGVWTRTEFHDGGGASPPCPNPNLMYNLPIQREEYIYLCTYIPM